ncbi:MAG: peptidylprolyl isomerase [Nitrospirota bacterium]|nr:peptidylprolyl isomerase [Nitrospirota bacterium]
MNQLKTLMVVGVLTMGLSAPAWAEDAAPSAGTGPKISIETKHGTVVIGTFPEDAPKTVARIAELAGSGFYDGVIFHRVVAGFVVQGGDPTCKDPARINQCGRSGSGQNLPAEFNQHQHVEGTVAMARSQSPNSADSQFYISLGRHPHLDNNYTVFGQVLAGMDVVKKIKPGDRMIHVIVIKGVASE